MGLFSRRGGPESVGGHEPSPDQSAARLRDAGRLVKRAKAFADEGDVRSALECQVQAIGQARIHAAFRPDTGNAGVALMLSGLARYQADLGEKDEAMASRREAARLGRAEAITVGGFSARSYRLNLFELAIALDEAGYREEMVKVGSEAARWFRKKDIATDRSPILLARILNRVANGLNRLGRVDEALQMRLEQVAVLDELEEREPGKRMVDLVTSLSALAALHLKCGGHDEGLVVAERCRTLLSAPGFEAAADKRSVVAVNFRSVAWSLGDAGRVEEAMTWFGIAAHLYRVLDAEMPGKYREELVRTLNSYAWWFGKQGRPDEGLVVIDEALRLFDTWDARESDAFIRRRSKSLDTAATLHLQSGRYADALPLSRQAVGLSHELRAKNLLNATDQHSVELCERLLARIEDRLGDAAGS